MDKEKQLQARMRIQQKAARMSATEKHLLITWATGCGKGRAVMMCIAASASPKKWLVVVPEILQIENFKNDLVKHGFAGLLGDKIQDIICYASFKKFKGGNYNLALNEVHRLSEEREKVTESISFDQIVSDSATVPDDVRERLYNICPFQEYNITVQDAIAMGILPQPEIILVPVTVNDVIKRNKATYGKKTFMLTDRKYLDKLDTDLKYWEEKIEEKRQEHDKKNEEKAANRFLQRAAGILTGNPVNPETVYEPFVVPAYMGVQVNRILRTRKAFISSLKTRKARKIIEEELINKRFICFTGSIEQSDELGKDYAIHSKKTAKQNKAIMDAFNNLEIAEIYANRMAREGINFEQIEAVIIIQLDSGANDNGLSFIQMQGRGLRGLAPAIYLMYVKGSQDEKYLKRALKHVNAEHVSTYGQPTLELVH